MLRTKQGIGFVSRKPKRLLTVGGRTPAMCEVCSRLPNLWFTGEWVCPKCGGPDKVTAEILHRSYVSQTEKEIHMSICIPQEQNYIESAHLYDIKRKMSDIVAQDFAVHPFRYGVNYQNSRRLMTNYAAMSEAFPSVQAGAQRPLIEDVIRRQTGVTEDQEVTSVVANFLTADETGVNFVLDEYGLEALPRILDTTEYFHSSLLKKDLKKLYGEAVAPKYDDVTCKYLMDLMESLSDLDSVRRCAAMVAFESHAGTMIEALWNRLAEIFPIQKDDLVYFRIHVGGENPAEPYHVEMTSRMINKLVPKDRSGDFVGAFHDAYSLSHSWCRAICELV